MTLDCNEIIEDRLWVGGCLRPEDVKLLARMDITTVFSLQSEKDVAGKGRLMQRLFKAFEAADILFVQVAVKDFDKDDLRRNLPRCVAELEQSLEPLSARVYLHCTAGINRAPTVAAAYLMHKLGMPAHKAHEFVVARRYCQPYLDLLEEYASTLQVNKQT
jgi:protein-tyrosine phosphatase